MFTVPLLADDVFSQTMEEINLRLQETEFEVGALEESHIRLTAISPEDKIRFDHARSTLSQSDMPIIAVQIDHERAALSIWFESQDVADQYVDEIERLIDVPFYTDDPQYTVAEAPTEIIEISDPAHPLNEKYLAALNTISQSGIPITGPFGDGVRTALSIWLETPVVVNGYIDEIKWLIDVLFYTDTFVFNHL